MRHRVDECSQKQPKRTQNFTTSIWTTLESFPREKAFKDVLSNSSQKSIQYLSLLTERTPASFVKLPFASNATVHWLRLQKPESNQPLESSSDNARPDTAAQAGATSALVGQSQDKHAACTDAVHDIIANSINSKARPRDADIPRGTPMDALERLAHPPLFYTSTTRPADAERLAATTSDSSSLLSL